MTKCVLQFLKVTKLMAKMNRVYIGKNVWQDAEIPEKQKVSFSSIKFQSIR